jgi:hypothetical protein
MQFWNADWGIELTLSGIVMLVNLEQLSKAEFPIKVTLLGILMLVKLEQ